MLAIGLIFFIRAILSILLPPVADEAYYIMWAQHPSWAYVDHPGMTAWLLAVAQLLIPGPFLAARILSAIIYTLTAIVIYDSVRALGKRSGLALGIALTLLLIPYHFVVGITYQVEQPLILGTALAIWSWIKLTIRQQSRYFYVLAAALAMMINTKLTAGFLVIGLLILIVTNRTRWTWVRNAHFWTAISLLVVSMVPFLVWQSHHQWISFMFHAKRVGEAHWFEHFFEFIGNQLLYLSPVLFAWFWIAARQKPRSQIRKDMLILAAILWVPFLILSVKTIVYPHWPIIATIPMLIAIADIDRKDTKKWIIGMATFSSVVLLVLLIVQPSYLKPEVRHNREVIPQIQALLKASPSSTKVLSDFHGSVGILSAFTGHSVGMTQVINANEPRWGATQIGLWESGRVPKGSNVLLWIDPSAEVERQLEAEFGSVTPKDQWHLTVLEPHITRKEFFWCENAKRDLTL